jgi:hypothetical protein
MIRVTLRAHGGEVRCSCELRHRALRSLHCQPRADDAKYLRYKIMELCAANDRMVRRHQRELESVRQKADAECAQARLAAEVSQYRYSASVLRFCAQRAAAELRHGELLAALDAAQRVVQEQATTIRALTRRPPTTGEHAAAVVVDEWVAAVSDVERIVERYRQLKAVAVQTLDLAASLSRSVQEAAIVMRV